MPREQTQIPGANLRQPSGDSNWMVGLHLGLVVLLSLLSWLLVCLLVSPVVFSCLKGNWGMRVLLVLGVLVYYGALSMVSERTLAVVLPCSAWRYRLAFLYSAALAGASSLLTLGPVGFATCLTWMLAGSGGSFLGGLITTGLNEGLWENNSPPPCGIREKVFQSHLEIIGKPCEESLVKRLFDLGLAVFGLLVSIPVWFLSTLLIWLEDPGPILFVKNSVGKRGVNFYQYKFRTMVREAENETGPVLADERDERVLTVGNLLRKTALDELPQLVNILKGEMSFVGPRPQRTILVHGYLQKMPEYAWRHCVRPGLSGLAQVAGDYYLTPRQKLRFDRLYIRHASLGFDLKLLLLAFLITFWYRWRKGWNGRLPRSLMRMGNTSRRLRNF